MARTVTITFGDGSQYVYNNVPETVTPDQIQARAEKDFAGKTVSVIDGGRGQQQEPPSNEPSVLESFGNRLVKAADAAGNFYRDFPTQAANAMVGLAEVPLTLATGGAGLVAGKVLDAKNAIKHQITGEPQDIVSGDKLAQSMTYQPRTEQAAQIFDLIGQGAELGEPAMGLPIVGQAVELAKFVAPAARVMSAQKLAAASQAVKESQLAKGAVSAAEGIPDFISAAKQAPKNVANTVLDATGIKKPAPEVAPVPEAAKPVYRAASPASLNSAAVKVPTSSGPITNETALNMRHDVLDAIGIDPSRRRGGAITNNPQKISEEINLAKQQGGEAMAEQLKYENNKLGEYANNIIEEIGGSPLGTDTATSGIVVLAPISGAADHFSNVMKNVYKMADEEAAKVGGIQLDEVGKVLQNKSNFKGGDGMGVRRDVIAVLKDEGIMDKNGNMRPITAADAERLRQRINESWDASKPQTKSAVSVLAKAVDDSVMKVLPEGIYNEARAMYKAHSDMFYGPKGIASILDVSGPGGINRAVSLDKITDKMVSLAGTDSAQFNHIMKVLDNMPTPELQEMGAAAKAEIRAAVARKILGKSIDMADVPYGEMPRFIGTGATMRAGLNQFKGKLENIFGEEIAARIKTLDAASHILRPVDKNISGSGAYIESALDRRGLLESNAERVGAGLGATVGALTGGPAGAVVMGQAGKALGKKGASIARQRQIDAVVAASLKTGKRPVQKF